jgi:MoxR-like ATPase
MTYGTQLAERVGWVQRRCNDLVRNVEHFIHGKTEGIVDRILAAVPVPPAPVGA